MNRQHITLAVCVGLLGLSACAHDQKAQQRTTVSAVTNEEMTGDEQEQGKTRMNYTEVDEKAALNQDGRAAGAETPLPDGSAKSASCELAVFFASDSATLDADAEKQLSQVADCMKRHEVDHALIVGRADASGTQAHNEKLGLERARAVAEYLRKLGVPAEDIRVRSKGEVASAESQQLWPSERRTSVSVQ